MDFELNRFQQEHYAEYAAWFADPELNRHLGPIDQEWIDAVLSHPVRDLQQEGVPTA